MLAALWGAVARIRDLRHDPLLGRRALRPERARGRAAHRALDRRPDAARHEGDAAMPPARGARARAGVSLERKVVVVADDDPAVTWFLAGVLRAAGAVVHEAHDGARALEIAYRVTPDLVITDVLMPVLDGFALCRALKRDLVLRDVPVILLSWKEDLLQRVRELGGGADGYLRKEASAPVDRAARARGDAPAPPRRAERLAAGGEVRGRLDGLTTAPSSASPAPCAPTPPSPCATPPSSTRWRSAAAAPCAPPAPRPTGAFERGPEVLAALLGVGAGRFVVAPRRRGRPASSSRARSTSSSSPASPRRARRSGSSRARSSSPSSASSSTRSAWPCYAAAHARARALAPAHARRGRLAARAHHLGPGRAAPRRGRALRRRGARRRSPRSSARDGEDLLAPRPSRARPRSSAARARAGRPRSSLRRSTWAR